MRVDRKSCHVCVLILSTYGLEHYTCSSVSFILNENRYCHDVFNKAALNVGTETDAKLDRIKFAMPMNNEEVI